MTIDYKIVVAIKFVMLWNYKICLEINYDQNIDLHNNYACPVQALWKLELKLVEKCSKNEKNLIKNLNAHFYFIN